MNFQRTRIPFLTLVVALSLPALSHAQLGVPGKINVQALVRDSSGDPVDMSYPGAEVALFDADAGGTEVWADTMDITITDGLVSLTLDVDSNIFAAYQNLWFELRLSDDLVVERRQMVSVPYAYHSDTTSMLPPGMVISYFGDTAPRGWLLADGSTIDKSVHPEYAALVDHLRSMGAAYQGANADQAVLPDLTGRFLRGKNADPVGTLQDDAVKSHTHTGTTDNGNGTYNCSTDPAGTHDHGGGDHMHAIWANYWTTTGSITGWGLTTHNDMTLLNHDHIETDDSGDIIDDDGSHDHDCEVTGGSHDHNFTTGSTGGSETRPRNISVLYVIKY